MNPLKASGFLRYAIDHPHPEFQCFTIGEVYIDSVRQNDKRPAAFRAMCPDEWIKNIRGNEDLQDIYMILKYPREMWEQYNQPVKPDDEPINRVLPVPEVATDGIDDDEINACLPLAGIDPQEYEQEETTQ